MKLNLASGTHPASRVLGPGHDWLNVDLPWSGVEEADVYADAFRLPFPRWTFAAVYVGHFLEHVDRDLVAQALLEVRRVAMPTAQIAVVGPALDLAEAIGEPENILDAIRTLTDGPGGHKWVATVQNTKEAVREVFPLARVVPVETVAPPTWPNPVPTARWQVALLASA